MCAMSNHFHIGTGSWKYDSWRGTVCANGDAKDATANGDAAAYTNGAAAMWHEQAAAAKAAGDPGMAERPLEPRDGYDALDPAQREQRNGRLCAHEHLPPLPGEIWCEITGEALDRAQHHCTVTFATFPKSLLQKKKKSASYVWQQHLAAIRAAFLNPAPTGAGTTLDEFSRVLHARWASETSASPPQCPQSGNPQSGYQMQS